MMMNISFSRRGSERVGDSLVKSGERKWVRTREREREREEERLK